jgi:hypothetical protein
MQHKNFLLTFATINEEAVAPFVNGRVISVLHPQNKRIFRT